MEYLIGIRSQNISNDRVIYIYMIVNKNKKLFYAALTILTVFEFLLLYAGIISQQLIFSLLNMTILMVVGGEILICILLLRIYDKIATISESKGDLGTNEDSYYNLLSRQ